MLLFVGGCRCAGSPAPATAHFEGWPELVRAVATDDAAGVRRAARDLVDLVDAPAEAHAVGAAAGFLQVAADRGERVDGLVEAAAACGGCHRDVGSPNMAAWSHEEGAEGVLLPLLWPGTVAAEPRADVPEPARRAFAAGGGAEARAAAVLRACAGCHGELSSRTPRSP